MTNSRLWSIVAAVASVGIIVLGWFLAISPALALADDASSQAQSIQLQNDTQEVQIAALKKEFQNLPDLKTELTALQRVIPEDPRLDDLLDELQNLAQANGVTITTFTASEGTPYGGLAASGSSSVAPVPEATPAPADPAAAPNTPIPAVAPGGGLTDRLYTIPVKIGLVGAPESVMAFINAAQLDTRFLLITKAGFTGAGSPTTAGGTIEGYVFVLRDPRSANANAATPSPTPTPTATPSPSPSATTAPSPTPEPTETATP